MIQSGKKSFKGRGENPGILIAQSRGCSHSCSLSILMLLLSTWLAGNSRFNRIPSPLWSCEELVPDMESRSEVQSVTVRKSMDKCKVPSEAPFVLAYLGSHPLVFPISDPAGQQ